MSEVPKVTVWLAESPIDVNASTLYDEFATRGPLKKAPETVVPFATNWLEVSAPVPPGGEVTVVTVEEVTVDGGHTGAVELEEVEFVVEEEVALVIVLEEAAVELLEEVELAGSRYISTSALLYHTPF